MKPILRSFLCTLFACFAALASAQQVDVARQVKGVLPVANGGTGNINGSAATLTTPRAIYGNNFDGSAALTQVIGSAYGGTGNGFTKFTGPTTSEKTFTLPDADATLLYAGGALGTPASGAATNLTGTAAGLTAGTVTTNANLTGPITSVGNATAITALASSYQWTAWNPSNVAGASTIAPNTGTADDSTFATSANSSGTVTLTFATAGKYLVSITGSVKHAIAYTFDRMFFNLGGTATRRFGRNDPANSGDPTNSSDSTFTVAFFVSATANQTLTIQPTLEVTGSGTTAQHTAYANVTTLYVGN